MRCAHLLLAAVFAVGTVVMGQGLSGQQPPPRGQMPDLGRTTKGDDVVPLFDFDAYFPGKWTFEWDVPESPIGPAGRIEGATVYRKVSDGVYEAVTTATGPSGPFTIKELIKYQRDQKTISREVTDSRGFTYTQASTIGGDLGGFYNIFFESTPFKTAGKTVRIKHVLRLGSPLAYRVAASVSVDGGVYSNLGNPWWRKEQ
jgi:hypothetical protein